MTLINKHILEVDALRGSLRRSEHENDLLREQLRLLRAQLYGKKSERLVPPSATQLLLFDEPAAPEAEGAVPAPAIEVPAHTRRKSGRQPLPEDLPRVEIIHDIAETEKVCGCGHDKSRIGEETSEQLDYIPATLQVLRHIRPKYACRYCEGVEGHGPTVMIAPPPAQIIPKSIVSAGLLAHILATKYVDAVPFYRQEGQFRRLGVEISRTNMSNWAIQAATATPLLLELLRKDLLSGPLINADETPVQVLVEPGRAPTQKSYMWVFRGGTPERPVLEFQYHPSRGGEVATEYFRGYKGYVQTDGYAGYDFLDRWPEIIHLGCWAHVRRKFVDVIKAAGNTRSQKKIGVAESAVARIGQLYAIEKAAREQEMSAEKICRERQTKAKPLVTAFRAWLDDHAAEVPPKSLLGKAIAYALGQWSRLEHYLEDGRLRMDNNLAENAIRPFVVGRKNWLFSGSVAGAAASATIYSLIETAKANRLDPYWYLRYLFDHLPSATSEEDIRSLLPNRIDPTLITNRITPAQAQAV